MKTTSSRKIASYYVETGNHDNTGLGRDVRFTTRDEAERAADVVGDFLGSRASDLKVEESHEPPTTTFDAWNAA